MTACPPNPHKQAFKLLITDKAVLDGLSDSTLAVAAENAAEDGHAGATTEAGPWLLKLDDSTFASIIQFAHNRELRERFFKAHSSVASSGETNNTPLVNEILAKRRELAALLGYKSWAEYRFTSKVCGRCGHDAAVRASVFVHMPHLADCACWLTAADEHVCCCACPATAARWLRSSRHTTACSSWWTSAGQQQHARMSS